jgi:Na+/proline symporter
MLLGASAVITAVYVSFLTLVGLSSKVTNSNSSGMHIIASTFLLPVGVTIYTFVGGIKAT